MNLIQQQSASYIGKLVQAKALAEGSPAHATLHALLATGGAVASNQNISASAIGGAKSSLLTNLFKTDSDATQQEQEAKLNLLAGLVTGIAVAVGQDPIEWQALYCRTHGTKHPPSDPPTLNQAILWIAKLGGYLARKHDLPPGPTVLWRGFMALHEATKMFQIMRQSD
ncbi:IS4 family transposase [Mycoavidus sp. SF9855]|uniref:IS4 family transposase n=1 Tax=Mycoavidus sp. SF9855 TaxID=2968475 RepID=UPI00211C927D|nr:IS4 family transposase [Mycoavidus sp. SF9855]UUM20808.1 hypothetical protein NQD60_04820 [Mycoavidus sp. SF9855]